MIIVNVKICQICSSPDSQVHNNSLPLDSRCRTILCHQIQGAEQFSAQDQVQVQNNSLPLVPLDSRCRTVLCHQILGAEQFSATRFQVQNNSLPLDSWCRTVFCHKIPGAEQFSATRFKMQNSMYSNALQYILLNNSLQLQIPGAEQCSAPNLKRKIS